MTYDAVVIGGGFTGLTAAYRLACAAKKVLVLEAEKELGGLAGCFPLGNTKLEKFYHHWFNNDYHILDLIKEIGLEDHLVFRHSNTGLYYNQQPYRLSSPIDVLLFTPLSWLDRIRLGVMVLKARQIEDWQHLENTTAEEWLKQIGGDKVYEVVWRPLLEGKFGRYYRDLAAVWMWNKLKLRGGSRSAAGNEQLVYFRGGFVGIADQLAKKIQANGGQILTEHTVDRLTAEAGRVVGVVSQGKEFRAKQSLATIALPLLSDLLSNSGFENKVHKYEKIKYLGNICQILVLKRSLSSTYWLNVNDPGFPFVGVIEHTNFEPASTYGGKHIAYLSKYLPVDDDLYSLDQQQLLEYSLPHIQRMFPAFRRDWIEESYLWKSPYSQPLVEKHYSRLIPPFQGDIPGLFVSTMAQIYPEDRGTNYAVRAGNDIAAMMLNSADRG